MKTELFDLVNRNHEAVKYIESKPTKQDHMREIIPLAIAIIVILLFMLAIPYALNDYSWSF